MERVLKMNTPVLCFPAGHVVHFSRSPASSPRFRKPSVTLIPSVQLAKDRGRWWSKVCQQIWIYSKNRTCKLCEWIKIPWLDWTETVQKVYLEWFIFGYVWLYDRLWHALCFLTCPLVIGSVARIWCLVCLGSIATRHIVYLYHIISYCK